MKTFFKNNQIILFLLISFLFHLTFIKVNFKKNSETEKEKLMNVEVVDQEYVKAIKQKLIAKKQIVNSEQNGEKKADDKSRYLGQADQTFLRETVAKKIDTFNQGGSGKITGGKSDDKKKSNETSKKNDVTSKEVSLSELGKVSMAKSKELESGQVDEASNEKLGQKKSSNGRGVSSNNDFIEGVALGDMTQLNTVEYKYFGFYYRIRQQLEQYWGNSLREKAKNLYGKGRVLIENENYITSVKLTIDEKGNIVKILVVGASGVKELDDAAVEAFNKAGPFPNPPTGLLKNGHAEIEWGFVVKS